MRRNRDPLDDRGGAPDVREVEIVGGEADADSDELIDGGPEHPPRRWLLPVGVLAVVAFVGAAVLTRSGDDDTSGTPSISPSAIAVSPVIPSFAQWPEGGFDFDPSNEPCTAGQQCSTVRLPADTESVRRAVVERFPSARRVRVETRLALDKTSAKVAVGGRTIRAVIPNGFLMIVVSRGKIGDGDTSSGGVSGAEAQAVVRGFHVAVEVGYYSAELPDRLLHAGERLAKDVRLVDGLP